MSFWETVGATALGGVIIALVGWSAALAWSRVQGKIGKRPDWIAELTPEGNVMIKRTRRKTAFAVTGGIYSRDGAELQQIWTITQGDIRFGDGVALTSSPDAQFLSIHWIDGERLTAQAPVPTDLDHPVRIAAQRQRRRLRLSRS